MVNEVIARSARNGVVCGRICKTFHSGPPGRRLGGGGGGARRGLKRNKRFCLFRARDRPYRKSANNARKLYDVICDIAMVLSPKSAENHEMRHRESERASRAPALIHAHKYGARASTQILVLPSTTDNMLLSHTGKNSRNSRNSSKINNITHACATPSPPHTHTEQGHIRHHHGARAHQVSAMRVRAVLFVFFRL